MKESIYPNVSREVLEDIILNIPDAISVCDEDSKYILVSKEVERGLGLSIKEIIGRPSNHGLSNLLYFQPDKVEEAIREHKDTEAFVMTKGHHPCIATIRPIFDENGKFKYTIIDTRSSLLLSKYNEHYVEFQKQISAFNMQNKYIQDSRYAFEIIAESETMKKTMDICASIANTDSSVLLTGESGTGKEVLANYIHSHSLRQDQLFIPINCSAIPGELMESEFFGYEKGSFTGANPKGSIGLFEAANKGTLFLDEIGDMPISIQPKFLRALETGKIKRIGAKNLIDVDIRIIAATNRDLERMVRDNKFRDDLYYRLNIVPIHIPPLRERVDDIIPLAESFLDKYNKKYARDMTISDQMKDYLVSAPWYGNVRELRNYIERYVVTNQFAKIESSFMFSSEAEQRRLQMVFNAEKYDEYMETAEKSYFEKLLNDCNGNVAYAIEKSGIPKSSFYKKISKFDLMPKQYKKD